MFEVQQVSIHALYITSPRKNIYDFSQAVFAEGNVCAELYY
jgi:hypothetical protein